MTLRTYLPYDVARCNGKELDGKPVTPCNTCARQEFRHQVRERQPWTATAPVKGYCSQHIDMEMKDE